MTASDPILQSVDATGGNLTRVLAPVDVSEARRELGIKTVAVSAGYITLLAGSASTSPAPLPPRLGGLFVRAEENVIC